MCERFRCLPEAGGLLDQDASLLGALRLVDMVRANAKEVSDGERNHDLGQGAW
jgi:hypothetical protein